MSTGGGLGAVCCQGPPPWLWGQLGTLHPCVLPAGTRSCCRRAASTPACGCSSRLGTRARARSATPRSPWAARRGREHGQGLCGDADLGLRPPCCQGALCWLHAGAPHAPGAAGAGFDTPLCLYLFVLQLCSFLNQVLPSSVCVLWVCACRTPCSGPGGGCCAPGRGRQGYCCCPWVNQQLCHGVELSTAGAHFTPVCVPSQHLLVPPSAETHHAGLDTKRPLRQTISAPCAMLLFSPKQHFGKSQYSLSPDWTHLLPWGGTASR